MDSDESSWIAFEDNLINEHRNWPELSFPVSDEVCKKTTRKRSRTVSNPKPKKQTTLSTFFKTSHKRKTKDVNETQAADEELLIWEQEDDQQEEEEESDVEDVAEVDDVNEDDDVDEAMLHQAEKEALAKIKERKMSERSNQKLIDIALEKELTLMQEYILADEKYEMENFGKSSWTFKKITVMMDKLKKVFEVEFSSLLNPTLVKRFAEHIFSGSRKPYLTSFLSKFANVAS